MTNSTSSFLRPANNLTVRYLPDGKTSRSFTGKFVSITQDNNLESNYDGKRQILRLQDENKTLEICTTPELGAKVLRANINKDDVVTVKYHGAALDQNLELYHSWGDVVVVRAPEPRRFVAVAKPIAQTTAVATPKAQPVRPKVYANRVYDTHQVRVKNGEKNVGSLTFQTSKDAHRVKELLERVLDLQYGT
jgi:hypothetical protein